MSSSTVPRPTDALHWIFIRPGRALVCSLSVKGTLKHLVHVQPLWAGDGETTDTFRHPADALRRHAEISWMLRQSGWLVADRSGARRAA